MSVLKTKYMGLELKNPIIVGASNLVLTADYCKRLEKAGAAAIVYKSLFEEQIQLENYEMDEGLTEYDNRHAEMTSLFPNIEHAGPEEHLHNLKELKSNLDIPVFASLNALYDVSWIDYAKEIEKAGVDGLELNFYAVPQSFDVKAADIEDAQVQIVEKVKKAVKIPIAVKLSAFYSNPLNIIKRMDEAGADAVVLFNRLFQPEIDTIAENLHFPYNLSEPSDNKLPLRFAGLLHGNIDANICSNTGIFSGKDVVKMILAGADTVQIVSVLYKHKPEVIAEILDQMKEWMKAKEYADLATFRGKLSKNNITDPFAYKRAQYVDILMKSDEIFKKYPLN